MKKIIYSAIGATLICSAVLAFSFSNKGKELMSNAGKIEVLAAGEANLPTTFDPTFRCRCKDGGCYGGNAISIRSACYKNTTEGDLCNKYNANCPS